MVLLPFRLADSINCKSLPVSCICALSDSLDFSYEFIVTTTTYFNNGPLRINSYILSSLTYFPKQSETMLEILAAKIELLKKHCRAVFPPVLTFPPSRYVLGLFPTPRGGCQSSCRHSPHAVVGRVRRRSEWHLLSVPTRDARTTAAAVSAVLAASSMLL